MEKMRASKTNAQQALTYLDGLPLDPSCGEEEQGQAKFIRDFLEAARAKLPTEEAFDREQAKRKAGAAPKKRR